jgi:pilus assembly protein Flp/PilA
MLFSKTSALISVPLQREAFLRAHLTGFIGNEKATTAIEYGLIAALIATVMLTGLNALGTALNGHLIVIGTSLQ